MMAHTSVSSSKHKVELDSHVETYVVGDTCWVIHDHDKPFNVYSYDPKNGHKCAKTVHATIDYHDP